MANYGKDTVAATLETLGIQIEPVGGGWGMALCPMHTDKSPSFTVHLTEGAWRCYSKCGSSGDLAVLVQKMRGGDLKRIQSRLKNMFLDREDLLLKLFEEPEKEEEKETEPLFYERGRMYPYLYKRGFTPEILKEFDCGIDPFVYDKPTDSYIKCVVVPVTVDHKLVGLYRRAIKGKKFKNSYGLDKENILFGLDHIPDDVDTVVVVEGALDAIWLFQHGYHAVATLGGGLSEAQAELLVRRFPYVILAFDSDEEGKSFERDGYALLRKRVVLTRITLPEGRKDVQQCSAEELLVAFSKQVMV